MSAEITLCFYLVIGCCVAVAVWLGDTRPTSSARFFRVGTALVFWPLYLPVLLTPTNVKNPFENSAATNQPALVPHGDEMAAAILQVETELDAALHSLDGWAEETLCRESDRFAELRSAWHHQAERIRELDRLLEKNAIEPIEVEHPVPNLDSSTSARIRASRQSRRENLSQLKLVRERLHTDLLGTLAWVRQLVTQIHLAHYTGEPASRAAELVEEIARAVEGLSHELPHKPL